jgi:hypothetical protein
MKRSPLTAATLTLLAASALVVLPAYAQEAVFSLPEVVVTGKAAERQHPQDGNYSDRPLGRVEVVTPSSTGNAHGGYFFARFAPSGIPVMPDLNIPSSAPETRPDQAGKAYQAPRAGAGSK